MSFFIQSLIKTKNMGKNSKNCFYFFMQEQKKVLRNEGIVWRDMKHLANLCAPKWKQISESDKQRYKTMARNAKEQDFSRKMTQVGTSLKSIQDERMMKKVSYDSMLSQIKETINTAYHDGIIVIESFLFVHVNILCKTQSNENLPCELAIGEYSLLKGITKVFHTFIRPRDVPIGYAFTIKNIASKSHSIEMDSPPMNYLSSSNYAVIAEKIKEMIIRDDGSVLPLYAIEENVKEVEDCLFDIFLWGGMESPFELKMKVFHLHLLFFELDDVLNLEECLKFQRRCEADYKLKDFIHSHISNLACKYHEEHDRIPFCSAFHVHKWAFIFSERLCVMVNVDLIAGAHKPYEMRRKDEQVVQFPLVISTVESEELEIQSHHYQSQDDEPDLRGRTIMPWGTTVLLDEKPLGRGSVLFGCQNQQLEVSIQKSSQKSCIYPCELFSFRSDDSEVPNLEDEQEFPCLSTVRQTK